MTFPNAANGIKKLFIGEILALFGALASGVAVFFAKPQVDDSLNITDFAATTNVELGLVGGFLAVGGVIMIVAFILQLIGIVKASKDEEAFKGALYLILFSLAASIVGSVLVTMFPGMPKFAQNIPTVVVNLTEILTTFLVIGGIASLGAKVNSAELQEKASKLLGIIVTVIVLKFVANCVILLFKENIADVIATILGILVVFFTLLQYILYLSLRSKAKNTLAEK